MTKLEKLDKNFRKETPKAGLAWLDGFSRHFALRGLAWEAENRRERNFRRLPTRAEKPLSAAVRELSHCPAGVFLSFFTSSPQISVRLELADLGLMDHMPATGMFGAELYFREGRDWIPAAVARPSLTKKKIESVLMGNAPRAEREYRLYLPLYKRVESVEVGFHPGSRVKPSHAPKGSRPIFFYGTSITQGGCANTAGSDFVSTVGRQLDTEVVNFGFSGNGKGQPEIARLIREVDAEIFVLDFMANAEVETFDRTLPEFIDILRKKRKSTPILLMSSPAYNQSLWDAKVRDTIGRKRDTVMRTYLALKDAGDTNLHFIDGQGLLPPGGSGSYVDGVHPTSHGFAIMAERLAPQLRAIRLASVR